MSLISYLKRGAGDEFETLLRPHIPHLYRLAYRFCGNGHDAEDLVQDMLVKLYPRGAELAKIDRLRPWLSRVLYYEFVDSVRRKARSPLGNLTDTDDDVQGSLETLASDQPGPEEYLERVFTATELEQALAMLSADHRALLILHDVEGHTLPELASLLEIPLGTLKSRLHRARTRLRALLTGDGTFQAVRTG